MLDYILFGSIGLLLLVLIGFLVIVIRDHMKSKSFELYVQQTEEELERQAETHRFEKPKRVQEQQREMRRQEPETTPRRREGPTAVEPRVPATETPAPTEAPETRRPAFETETPHRGPVRTEPQPSLFETPGTTEEEPAKPQPAAAAAREEGRTVYPFPPQGQPEETPAQRQAQEILAKDYGSFSHQRLVEGMGLSPEEADEFVVELIGQLEAAIGQLDELIEKGDYTEVEHVTHGLKGAALNIGEGGVAQLLIDYNTYMKHGTEKPVVEAFQTRLKQTVSDLKVEYSQVA